LLLLSLLWPFVVVVVVVVVVVDDGAVIVCSVSQRWCVIKTAMM